MKPTSSRYALPVLILAITLTLSLTPTASAKGTSSPRIPRVPSSSHKSH